MMLKDVRFDLWTGKLSLRESETTHSVMSTQGLAVSLTLTYSSSDQNKAFLEPPKNVEIAENF